MTKTAEQESLYAATNGLNEDAEALRLLREWKAQSPCRQVNLYLMFELFGPKHAVDLLLFPAGASGALVATHRLWVDGDNLLDVVNEAIRKWDNEEWIEIDKRRNRI